jgi:hypothetical protein
MAPDVMSSFSLNAISSDFFYKARTARMFSVNACLLQQSLNMTFKMALAWAAIETIWENSLKIFLSPSTKMPLKFFNAKFLRS